MKEKIIATVVLTLATAVLTDVYLNSSIRIKWMARRTVKNS